MKPAFVLDCSLAVSWCFKDEFTVAGDALLVRMSNVVAVVPSLWFLEVTNVLALAERKHRLTADDVAEFLEVLASFQLEIDTQGPDRAFEHLLPVCRQFALTSYDAVYLDLALRTKLPLATLDDDLRRAAKKLKIELLGREP